MEKKCNICNSFKNVEDFYKNQTRCKSCTKQYALENKEKIKDYKKDYKESGKRSLSDKKYYSSNKEAFSEKNKKSYQINYDKIRESQKEYREENKEILLIKGREYSKKYKLKNQNNPLFILKGICRSSLRNALNKQNYIKNKKTEEVLGCSFEEFKLYIESKFESWMTWDNHGKYKSGELNYGWDIDHIIPLDSANTEEEILKLNHYTNLQPLCSYTNRHIKMYKVTNN